MPGSSKTAIGRELGVHRTLISQWIKQFEAGKFDPAPGTSVTPTATSEVEQLRRELAKVKMERDILKKALGYFAKDPM
jgi:transposase